MLGLPRASGGGGGDHSAADAVVLDAHGLRGFGGGAVVEFVLLLYSYEFYVLMRVLKWALPLPIDCGQGFPL